MAHKKAGGSTSNVRDSQSKRLGVKVFGGQTVTTGDIIVRQRGTRFFGGSNVFTSKDHSLHAAGPGIVKFHRVKKKRFDGSLHSRMRVEVAAQTVETKPKKVAAKK